MSGIKQTFRSELTDLINKYSVENWSNTPDYLLAEYVEKQLRVFGDVMVLRDGWYDGDLTGNHVAKTTTVPTATYGGSMYNGK